jgi:hypothetical protein
VVVAHLRHARRPIDPQVGDWLVVGDDDAPPVLAEVLDRQGDVLRLRLLAGPADSHPVFSARREPSRA